MNKSSIVNLKCLCFLFRYPNLDKPSQALFNLHMGSALPLRCGSEDDQNFQSPPGHSRRPVRRHRYCMVIVWHSVALFRAALSDVQFLPYSGLHYQMFNSCPIQGCIIRLSVVAQFRAPLSDCQC